MTRSRQETESRQETDIGRAWRTVAASCVAFALFGLAAGSVHAAKDMAAGSVSGLPVPRFVSLKSDHVNVRGGPTKDHDVSWVYTRAGLPVEVTAEFENWRRVRDSEGAEGWVYHSLLTGKRTAVVVLKSRDDLVPLHDSADTASTVVARLQMGVVAQVKRCNGLWCRVIGGGFDGWIDQQRLWGVYPGEKID
ncbi:MAG: aspartyl-trna synthetase [Xanthobacteraceae bacterium]|nr:MAG: aspartyl-trna synthetase [Xanthobacteraceae bacterium]